MSITSNVPGGDIVAVGLNRALRYLCLRQQIEAPQKRAKEEGVVRDFTRATRWSQSDFRSSGAQLRKTGHSRLLYPYQRPLKLRGPRQFDGRVTS